MSTNVPIASVTLSSAESSITFADIPQTYTDLVLISNIKGDTGNVGLNYQFNSDTASNYSTTILAGNGTSISSDRYSSQTSAFFTSNYGAGTNDWVTVTSNIQNYSNSTTCKTILSRWSKATGQSTAAVALWRKTPEAISNIKISSIGVNFISGSTFSLYGINAANSAQAKATGGDSIYRDSSYWYHIFNKSGTLTPYTSISNVDYLVVAGGGSGGTRFGGGGGAGGMITGSGMSLTAQAYTVTVGAGAARQTANSNFGFAGSNSIFNGQTAYGGGLGGGNGGGGNGGSGGGGGQSSGGGTGTSGQGNNGANGSWSGQYSGGGGGGKGSAGSSGTGGSGQASSISGTSVTYAAGGNGSDYYANTQGATGAANTGNGGGGSGGDSNPSGAGGSGIVIVRYPV